MKYKVIILGAGTGGICVAARLRKVLGADQIAVIDPTKEHFYQPLWTLVGAGIVKKEVTKKNQQEVIPKGVIWIQERVDRIDRENREVICSLGLRVGYEYLVVATGLKLDFHKIKGLEGNLGKNGLCSIYQYEDAEKTAEMIQNFQGGKAIFVMPPVPIKCAGAPQKIMYLADEIFRQNGVREKSTVTFASAGKVIFGVPAFANPLSEVIKRREIEEKFSHRLVEVKTQSKEAIFEKTREALVNGQAQFEKELVTLSYDLLHVVPPMSPHSFIEESGLSFISGPQEGWLKVDQFTLQHQDDPRVFGIGDVTGIPNSKTGAAIRKQAPVVVKNLLDVMSGKHPSANYDGYSSCPLITDIGKVILAEFGYDGKLLPSFPMDMTKERRSMWILKKNLLPHIYWKGMLKGRM